MTVDSYNAKIFVTIILKIKDFLMKNKMLWIGSVIILILSVICFVVFGVGTELIRAISGEGNGISFGKYNKKEIVLAPGTDFANAVQYYTNFY